LSPCPSPLIYCRCRPVHRLSSSSTQVLFNFSYPVPSQHMWLLCSRRHVIGGPLSIPQWHYVAGCLLPKLRILHCCSTRYSMSSLILDLVQILARDSRFWSYPAPVPILALGRRLRAFSILYLRSRLCILVSASCPGRLFLAFRLLVTSKLSPDVLSQSSVLVASISHSRYVLRSMHPHIRVLV